MKKQPVASLRQALHVFSRHGDILDQLVCQSLPPVNWVVIIVSQVKHARNFATVLFSLAERGEESAGVVFHTVWPGG